MRFFVCPPTHYSIDYSINPWMDVSQQADQRKAALQWQRLIEILHLAGAEIVQAVPKKGLPDIVFTANAALVSQHDNAAIISRFTHPERQGEEVVFKEWFENYGYRTVMAPVNFEGAGDALWAGKTLFLGFGFRSSPVIAPFIRQHFNVDKIVLVRLMDDRFYHLDTCFCPLNDHQALIYSGATNMDLSGDIELIEVPEEEAVHFACNAVVIDKTVVMPTGCPQTRTKLENMGFVVMETEMTEFLKAGGACKCLTLVV